MQRYTILCVLLVATIMSCRKNVSPKITTISGRLLESSSNPVPVAGYKLTFNQDAILSFLGSHSHMDEIITTDNDGHFSFSYTLKRGSGVARYGTNSNPLYISSDDTLQHKGLNPRFFPISVSIDTNFNAFYLYKKIDRLVRKVKFEKSLSTGEFLQVITSGTSEAHYKLLAGPIAAGTMLTVDTISNYKNARLDLRTRKYILLSSLVKPGYQTNLDILLDIGDENYREILMTY